jgi:hypothetical protein
VVDREGLCCKDSQGKDDRREGSFLVALRQPVQTGER